MGIKTKIEWCDSTINPIVGCTGCALREDHCYAATLCTRYAGRKGWPKSFDEPEFFPGRIAQALKWSDLTGKVRPGKPWLDGYPRIIFVNDLGDGFCPDVDPDTWLPPQSLGPMAASPHIWLLLTKWPGRMRKFFERYQIPDNFWLGTSICRQCDEWRIRELSRIPAAISFVSVEPMLGPVNLGPSLYYRTIADMTAQNIINEKNHIVIQGATVRDWSEQCGLDWVICGGESGPGARPMRPDWARRIRDQCQDAGVPFFFKQWGTWRKTIGAHDLDTKRPWFTLDDGTYIPPGNHRWHSTHLNIYVHLGKKRAGRLLDGREHDDLPNTPRTQP